MKIIFLVLVSINFLFSIEIFDVTKTTAKISITNLNNGHSGIIIKKIENNSIIVTQAVVIDSNNLNSTIKFIKKEIIPQDAIPTTTLIPQNGDQFILNHLYTTSLLIAPNLKAKNKILEIYPNQNFLNEDFFAAHLKIINSPLPTKKIITDFAQSQQIGTIFIVAENKLFILDSITFKIIDSLNINYNDNSTMVPFLTKIENIELGIWDFGDDTIEDYNKYYLKLVENK